jgi:hypothetical protein
MKNTESVAARHARIFLRWAAIAMLLAGCNRREAVKPAAGAAPVAASDAAGPRVFRLTPEAFFAEFKANPDAIHEKYQGGSLEIAGTVEEVGANLASNSVVSIRAGGEKDAIGLLPVVQCVMTDPEPWAKLARGQQATIRGDIGYLPFQANMENCRIVASGPPTVLTVSASQLASELADKDKFKKTYAGKNVIVTGKVVEKKADTAGAISLALEGVGGTDVHCDFAMIESTLKKVVPAVTVGQKVQVFGEIQDFNRAAGVTVSSCHPITR